jgi:hypothetical protein
VDPNEKSSFIGCEALSTKVVRTIAAGARLTPDNSNTEETNILKKLNFTFYSLAYILPIFKPFFVL